jgi:uncharacterized protein with NAD-binding domain and iron-sulfur cluster
MAQPEKIVVLGGGMSAMTTIFELTEQPNWQERYEITVYQLGWRLGGKGASGRGENGRIEEHGLHLWFGFYENAFNLMQRCFDAYQSLGLYPDSPIRQVSAAFTPQEAYEYEELIDGQWLPWRMNFKVTPDLYPGNGERLLSIWEAMTQVIQWLHDRLLQLPYAEAGQGEQTSHFLDKHPWLRAGIHSLAAAEEAINSRLAETVYTHGAQLLIAAHEVTQRLHPDPVNHQAIHHNLLTGLLDEFHTWLQAHPALQATADTELRRLGILLELAVVHVKGLLADGVLFHGLTPLNRTEYTAWLKQYGASPSVYGSALIRGMYDTAFCYKDGVATDENRTVAAGTAIYGLLRMFLTYQGAIFFKMNAGMGDVIFAPLYAVLKARGVRFNFFHRVKNLGLSADKRAITRIDLARQVDLKDPTTGYDPFVYYHNLPCWPSKPHYDQLVQGNALIEQQIELESFWTPWQDVDSHVKLEAGQDFDKVVLGISLGAMRYICPELIAANERWAAMVNNLPTVMTQEFELWFNRSLAEMGRTGPVPLMMGFAEPGDVWTDMSYLLPQEDWQGEQRPKSISYLGGTFRTPAHVPAASDHTYPEQARQQAMSLLISYLNQSARPIWPKGTRLNSPNGLDWRLLAAPTHETGASRVMAQWIRVNIDPSERHVQSPANTQQYRMKAGETGFERLYITGDWTDMGILSFGCIEGAAIAGMLTARAISGQPAHYIGEEIQ